MKWILLINYACCQGAGPVHLIGQHMLGALVEEFEDMEEMEEEMLDEEEGDDSQFKVHFIVSFAITIYLHLTFNIQITSRVKGGSSSRYLMTVTY